MTKKKLHQSQTWKWNNSSVSNNVLWCTVLRSKLPGTCYKDLQTCTVDMQGRETCDSASTFSERPSCPKSFLDLVKRPKICSSTQHRKKKRLLLWSRESLPLKSLFFYCKSTIRVNFHTLFLPKNVKKRDSSPIFCFIQAVWWISVAAMCNMCIRLHTAV